METVCTSWAGSRKARVLSRSLTGPSFSAQPARADIDPNILKHVIRTRAHRSSSSTSSPLPFSSDGSLPVRVTSRHSSHESIIHVRSAQSVDGTSCERRPRVGCASADNAPRTSESCSPNDRVNKLVRTLRPASGVSPGRSPNTYYRVLEFLACGSVEAATNGQLLCANKIGYLLNLTGVECLRKKTSLACSCNDTAYHNPVEQFVDIEKEANAEQTMTKFTMVNRFIADARSKGGRILIFSLDGNNSCQAMALQYVMHYHRLPLVNAMDYMRSVAESIDIKLSGNFDEALSLWDAQLEQRRKADRASVWRDGCERPGSVSSVGSFHSQRKIAWI